ncbi:uroporphyrinogen-III C-methyltransferase [Kerstersia gyiorum]|uniref:uroporphyrinogen-III C-methyltransferase n=1 Tax=Kerstersia gyiorum TaxID=206506 RepID=UPI00214F7867|nr:uroporphyrinogen-III C-methyltransferase [Kerstersia gyiorum]MCR4159782.1 uroporphyrinogen-III C-methyltransferase [Kerstersia gyiorum]
MTKESINHDASVTQHPVPEKSAAEPSKAQAAAVPPSPVSSSSAESGKSAADKVVSATGKVEAGTRLDGKGSASSAAPAAPAAPEAVRPKSADVPPPPPDGGKARTGDKGGSGRGKRGGFSLGWLLALILVLVVLALGYGAWQQSQEFDSAGREVATRLENLERELAGTRREAQEALALARAQDAKVRANDAALQEARSQYLALEQAWQRFSNGTDDHYLLDDVARALEIADQQLRLAGSVSNALVALEAASARLADTDRPRFQALKAALDTDLERLRAVPVVDVPAIAARLHRLQALLATAPLMVPDEAAPRPVQLDEEQAPIARHNSSETLPEDAAWWTRWQAVVSDWAGDVTDAIGQELRGFVSVQRVGNPDALRLSPEQGAYLRNGVRTRLLTAQLALMMRQAEVWKGEIEAVRSIVADYYDGRTPDAVAALRSLDELLATNVAQPLPSLDASLAALESLRAETRNAAGLQED